MEGKKNGLGIIHRCPCWWARLQGRRDGKRKRDGSQWVARQVDQYRRFEIRELEKTKNDQAEPRRKAGMICTNLDQVHRKIHCEEDRLRAEEFCLRWLGQLKELKQLLNDREESCVYHCMHEDTLCRERIRAYLQEFERFMPKVSQAEDYRIGDSLYTGESSAWQVYRENIHPLREEMDDKLLRKGVK